MHCFVRLCIVCMLLCASVTTDWESGTCSFKQNFDEIWIEYFLVVSASRKNSTPLIFAAASLLAAK